MHFLNTFQVIALSSPLALLLLSMALLPLISPKFWHKYETAIFIFVTLTSLISFSLISDKSVKILKNVVVDDYIPFIITLFTLYVLSSGIHIKVRYRPSTMANITFLGIGSIFSSLIGTTGASMLLLRPFLEMNKVRTKKTHLAIFFIFLISNIGGLLTPLGDPPLLIGYLRGVHFLWEIEHLFIYWLVFLIPCLIILYVIDRGVLKDDPLLHIRKEELIGRRIEIRGSLNVCLITSTVIILFIDSIGIITRSILLISMCMISIICGKRANSKIDLLPFREVAVTFMVIFIVIAPVLFTLETNSTLIHEQIDWWKQHFAESTIYYSMCALASSFLDNAPSYLLFFNMAGGNAAELMTSSANILEAISVSSVVMGSMTYIGNAPNMMVKSIAQNNGVRMPSFLGYMGWAAAIIIPISIIVNMMIG